MTSAKNAPCWISNGIFTWRPEPFNCATTGTSAINRPTPNRMDGNQILAAIETAAISIALTPPAITVSTKPIPVCATDAIKTGVASLIKLEASSL